MRAFKTPLLVILSLIVFSVFLKNYSKNPESDKHYLCILSNKPLIKPNHELKGKISYFNRPLAYKPSKNYANFDYFLNHISYFQKKGSVFSGSYRKSASQQGYMRDIFHVFRIDLKTQILVRSYIYHVPQKDYEKNFKQFAQYRNSDSIFKLTQFPKRKNYVKVGWDKSFWQCHTQNYFQHITNSAWYFLIQFLSV